MFLEILVGNYTFVTGTLRTSKVISVENFPEQQIVWKGIVLFFWLEWFKQIETNVPFLQSFFDTSFRLSQRFFIKWHWLFDANEFCLPFACGLARARELKLPQEYHPELVKISQQKFNHPSFVGVCHPVVQMITIVQTKIVTFNTHFQTRKK